jgi:uncharacterized protein (TIRG00374 family)
MKKKWGILVSTLILVFIVYTIGDKIGLLFQFQLHWNYFIFALLIPTILNPIIINNRTMIFLKVLGIKEKFKDLVAITYISFFYGFLLPSSNGMDAVRIYQIEKRNPTARGMAGAAVLMERILGIIILMLLSVFSLIFMEKSIFSIVGIPVLVCFSIIFGLLGLILNKTVFAKIIQLFDKVKLIEKITTYLLKLSTGFRILRKEKKIFLSIPLILSLQLANIFLVYLLYKTFGIEINFFTHLVFVPIIQLLSLIPISINGFGIREGGFVFLYNLIDVDKGLSMVVSILYFLILIGIPSIIGGVLNLFFYKKFNPKHN